MSKIYDALSRAQKEKVESWNAAPAQSPPVSTPSSVRGMADTVLEKAMARLYQSIDSLLPYTPKKVVQFIGSRKGEGTSTIVHDFGLIMSAKFGKRVLILDANRQNPAQHLFFGVSTEFGWEDLLSGDAGSLEQILYQIDESNLYVCPVSAKSAIIRHVFDSMQMDGLLKQLRRLFDLVIVDSPPAALSPEGPAFSRSADGVVLVLGADTTRWPVALGTKEAIEKNGGNILGVVFGKHRYHIPEFIYKRL